MSAADLNLDAPQDEIQEAARLWWLLLAGGLLSLVVGLLLLIWPSETLATVALIVGIYLLLAGVVEIGLAFSERSDSRTGALLRGTLAGVAGLIVIRHPGGSTQVVALAVGIVLVVTGVVRLGALNAAVGGRGWLLLEALVDIAIGVVLVAWPKFGVSSFAVLLGISLLVRGVLEATSAFALRSLAHVQPGADPASAPSSVPSG
jgi:uncharacterized membrane protein HdeD (DUF308 family)